jgi:light-regulated signal transduction histidine kinase (bacteriophytochrome)
LISKGDAMVDFPQTAGWGVLKFFGHISASISHELKNSLSIVNENAGLLEDLARLTEKGRNLDIERVKTLSASIGRQVKRTDQIIRNMNKFAHSVDMEIKSVDIREYLELIAAVSARLLAARNITLEIVSSQDRPSVMTSPIFMLYLFWHLIDCCSRWAEPGKKLQVAFGRAGGPISIQFHGCAATNPDFITEVEGKNLNVLLALLGCSLEMDTTQPGINLSFHNNLVEDG